MVDTVEVRMKILYVAFGLLIWVGLTSLTFQNTPAVPKPMDYTSCVRIFDKGTAGINQKVFQFYNGCPVDLYFSACVHSGNDVQIFESPRYVMTNGYWTIYAQPFTNPKQVKWAAGTSPVQPPEC